MDRLDLLKATLAIVITVSIMPVHGQAYPNRPVRFVTAAVGGGNDFAARIIKLILLTRGAIVEGDAEQAADILHEALALWRGRALADFEFDEFAQAAIGRLEERPILVTVLLQPPRRAETSGSCAENDDTHRGAQRVT